MDLNEFRQLKETGGLLVDDAGLQDATTEVIDDRDEVVEEFEEETLDEVQDDSEVTDSVEEEEIEELSPKEKTAFEKRLEREQKKLEEKLRSEMEETYKQKYSKHDEAIQLLGGDPDKILSAARDSQIQRQALQLAEQNGWSQEDTQWYIEQQKQQQELKELRVSMQINRLKDNPDYAGIASMEKEILSRIDKSNGALNVEEAFWAVGGPKRVEQIKLEAQQREVAKRSAPTRTVQKDSASSAATEKPLPQSVLQEATRMGISADEARRLMSRPISQNIDEYRKNKVNK